MTAALDRRRAGCEKRGMKKGYEKGLVATAHLAYISGVFLTSK